MTPNFIAKPPLPVKRTSIKHLGHLLASLYWIVWQIVTPFKSRPEPVDELPDPASDIDAEQLKQSQWIFDQAASRRAQLEQKAQSTFGLMLFLVPALSSLFVFVISKSPAGHATVRSTAIALIVISAALLFLGFISAVRAISVKAVETLYVHSVVDENGQFKQYNRGFHARGLLYCAAMNEAINDHIAQFVKGAHVLTAAAVIAIIVAAVPTCYVFSGVPASAAQTKIVGPVEVSLPDAAAMRREVTSLKADVGTLLVGSRTTTGDLKRLDEKVSKLDATLRKLRRPTPQRAREE
jgi:hypothetical protein